MSATVLLMAPYLQGLLLFLISFSPPPPSLHSYHFNCHIYSAAASVHPTTTGDDNTASSSTNVNASAVLSDWLNASPVTPPPKPSSSSPSLSTFLLSSLSSSLSPPPLPLDSPSTLRGASSSSSSSSPPPSSFPLYSPSLSLNVSSSSTAALLPPHPSYLEGQSFNPMGLFVLPLVAAISKSANYQNQSNLLYAAVKFELQNWGIIT
eukprot:GHVS01072917.1.p1 GENE.GHVS01072917.1~~GHVS01072917.1.p1  ORF type:complete len:207 (-),score=80.17 GHVS01072917.1:145-765(-)